VVALVSKVLALLVEEPNIMRSRDGRSVFVEALPTTRALLRPIALAGATQEVARLANRRRHVGWVACRAQIVVAPESRSQKEESTSR
jgi:hypothetical protein